MKDFLRACCAAAAACILSLPASATTLSFDELSAPDGTVFGSSELAGVYQGFDFGAGGTTGWALFSPGDGTVGITLATGIDPMVGASIGGSNPFTFTQAWFTASSPLAPGASLPIVIALIGTDGSTIYLGDATSASGPATLALTSGDGFQKRFLNPLPATEIAQMRIYGWPGTFVVDDIELMYLSGSGGFGGGTGGGGTGGGGTGGLPLGDGSHVTPIPEPSTYAMLLAGLGCIVLVARRRQMQS